MKKVFYSLGLAFLIACGSDDDNKTTVTPTNPDTTSNITQYEGYTVIWNDEFNGSEIDASKWVYETGDGTDYDLPKGWGNSELQVYTTDPQNSSIKEDEDGNSVLSITAIKSGTSYTSAKLTTNGTFGVRFGRIEAKIKLPQGKGMWPAFWTLGTNRGQVDWPGCGEIDILELLGDEPNKVHSTVHYTNGSNGKGEIGEEFVLANGTFAEDYHIVRLDWTPDAMTFYMDEKLINQVPIEADMKEFLREHYLILNLAVGGNWPGNPDASTVFPQAMLVDYVRVYSQDDLNPPSAPTLDVAEETLGQFIEASIADNAIKEGFEGFGTLAINSYGGGGEPDVYVSDNAVDGDSSIILRYPGGSWGGAFIELDQDQDFSSASSGNLYFSVNATSDLNDVEIKLESPGQATTAAVMLVNYTPSDLGNSWFEYQIPMADFSGLDLTKLKIPFSMWNPTDSNGDFVQGDILIDNIYIQ